MWKNRDESSAWSAVGQLLTTPSRTERLVFTQSSSGLFQGTFFQRYCCKGQNICSVCGATINTGVLTPSRGIQGLVAEHQPPVLFKDTHSGQTPVLYRTDPPTLTLLAWTQWNFPHFLHRKRRTRLAVALGLRTTPFLQSLLLPTHAHATSPQGKALFKFWSKIWAILPLKKCSSLFQTKAKSFLGLEWGCRAGDHLHLLLLCVCYNIKCI